MEVFRGWRHWLHYLVFFVLSFKGNGGVHQEYLLQINLNRVVQVVSERFLSLSIDPVHLLSAPPLGIEAFNMLTALSPMFIRLGGPSTSKLKFEQTLKSDNYTISELQWMSVNEFARKAGADLIVSLNTMQTHHGVWDTRNALELISFSNRHKYEIAWQLGYDMNSFGTLATGTEIGRSAIRLRMILDAFLQYTRSPILGPDLNVNPENAQFHEEFRAAAGSSIAAIPLQLEVAGSSNEEPLQMSTMSRMEVENLLFGIHPRSGKTTTKKPIWIAESEISLGDMDEALAWIRRLGSAAKAGYQVVMRQPHLSTLSTPTPDFWASLLYKFLVGREVLDARIMTTNSSRVHAFSHCTQGFPERSSVLASGVNYGKGSTTVYGVNLGNDHIKLSMRPTSIKVEPLHVYQLTANELDPRSPKQTYLNGKLLALSSRGELPILSPWVRQARRSQSVLIQPRSIFFVVMPESRSRVCSTQVPSKLPAKDLREFTKRLRLEVTTNKVPTLEKETTESEISDDYYADTDPEYVRFGKSGQVHQNVETPNFAPIEPQPELIDPDDEPVRYVTFNGDEWLGKFADYLAGRPLDAYSTARNFTVRSKRSPPIKDTLEEGKIYQNTGVTYDLKTLQSKVFRNKSFDQASFKSLANSKIEKPSIEEIYPSGLSNNEDFIDSNFPGIPADIVSALKCIELACDSDQTGFIQSRQKRGSDLEDTSRGPTVKDCLENLTNEGEKLVQTLDSVLDTNPPKTWVEKRDTTLNEKEQMAGDIINFIMDLKFDEKSGHDGNRIERVLKEILKMTTDEELARLTGGVRASPQDSEMYFKSLVTQNIGRSSVRGHISEANDFGQRTVNLHHTGSTEVTSLGETVEYGQLETENPAMKERGVELGGSLHENANNMSNTISQKRVSLKDMSEQNVTLERQVNQNIERNTTRYSVTEESDWTVRSDILNAPEILGHTTEVPSQYESDITPAINKLKNQPLPTETRMEETDNYGSTEHQFLNLREVQNEIIREPITEINVYEPLEKGGSEGSPQEQNTEKGDTQLRSSKNGDSNKTVANFELLQAPGQVHSENSLNQSEEQRTKYGYVTNEKIITEDLYKKQKLFEPKALTEKEPLYFPVNNLELTHAKLDTELSDQTESVVSSTVYGINDSSPIGVDETPISLDLNKGNVYARKSEPIRIYDGIIINETNIFPEEDPNDIAIMPTESVNSKLSMFSVNNDTNYSVEELIERPISVQSLVSPENMQQSLTTTDNNDINLELGVEKTLLGQDFVGPENLVSDLAEDATTYSNNPEVYESFTRVKGEFVKPSKEQVTTTNVNLQLQNSVGTANSRNLLEKEISLPVNNAIFQNESNDEHFDKVQFVDFGKENQKDTTTLPSSSNKAYENVEIMSEAQNSTTGSFLAENNMEVTQGTLKGSISENGISLLPIQRRGTGNSVDTNMFRGQQLKERLEAFKQRLAESREKLRRENDRLKERYMQNMDSINHLDKRLDLSSLQIKSRPKRLSTYLPSDKDTLDVIELSENQYDKKRKSYLVPLQEEPRTIIISNRVYPDKLNMPVDVKGHNFRSRRSKNLESGHEEDEQLISNEIPNDDILSPKPVADQQPATDEQEDLRWKVPEGEESDDEWLATATKIERMNFTERQQRRVNKIETAEVESPNEDLFKALLRQVTYVIKAVNKILGLSPQNNAHI